MWWFEERSAWGQLMKFDDELKLLVLVMLIEMILLLLLHVNNDLIIDLQYVWEWWGFKDGLIPNNYKKKKKKKKGGWSSTFIYMYKGWLLINHWEEDSRSWMVSSWPHLFTPCQNHLCLSCKWNSRLLRVNKVGLGLMHGFLFKFNNSLVNQSIMNAFFTNASYCCQQGRSYCQIPVSILFHSLWL